MATASKNFSLVVANGGTDSPAFETRDYVRGSIRMPAALTSVVMSFTACATLAGTYVPIWGGALGADALVSRTVGASKAYKIPDEVFDHPFVKFKLGSAEAAARTLGVTLKRGAAR